jgi:crotonobetainyl-CoA:carnitine CoA-transferase CaiB-like acyl-CoA transferase
VEQTYPQAGAQAAVGTLIAHIHRARTGKGQHVDVSMQEAMAFVAYMSPAYWELKRDVFLRAGPKMFRGRDKVLRQIIYPCKDGYVCWQFLTSVQGGKTKALVDWMDEENMAPEFLKNVDFKSMEFEHVRQEDLVRWEEPIARFFLTKTRELLGEEARKRGILLFPVNDIRDVVRSPQLAFRRFWQTVEHPELGEAVQYPGSCWRSNEPVPGIGCRAPLIGEHNESVYLDELGLSKNDLKSLRKKGII